MPWLDKLVGYFGIVFALAILARVILVRRQIGKSPVVVSGGRSAHDVWHGVLALVIKLEAMSIILFRLPAHYPSLDFYGLFVPLAPLRHPLIEAVGLLLATAGLIFAVAAQTQMGRNWRVGNDAESDTELVRMGLYARSRNPIYVGFVAISTGLFLAMPNVVTLACAILNPLALSRIVSLEEDFQRTRHGKAFDDYATKVPRWF